MEKVLRLFKKVNGLNYILAEIGIPIISEDGRGLINQRADNLFPNENEQIEIYSFEYNAPRMGGTPTIKATVKHKNCLDNFWDENVYAEFNGEKYYVLSTPSSSKDNTDERYVHELELKSEREALNNVYFIDAVQGDASIDQTKSNTSKVMFMGDINEFAARFNASFAYSNLPYKVVVNEGITSEVKLVSFEKLYLMSALQEIYNIFNIPYYFDGATIHIGYTEDAIPNVFRYGSQDALLSISKNNANYRIVNRCTGKGSSDNIPYYYPNKTAKGDLIAKAADTNVTLKQANIQITDAVKFSEMFNINDKAVWEYIDSSDCVELVDVEEPNRFGYWNSVKTRGFSVALSRSDGGPIWSGSKTLRITYRIKKKCDIAFLYKHLGLEGSGVVISGSDLGGFSGKTEPVENVQIVTFNYNKMATIFDGTSTIRFRCYLDINAYKQQVLSWTINDEKVDLNNYGISIVNISEDAITEGDSIGQELGTLIPPTGVLMPPIYRNSLGKESFYNALNNTYKKPNSEEYYVFENEYKDNNRKEIDVDFEDIKPTIVGMTNAAGQRMDKFIDFAWDDDDNDEFNYETNEYMHQYFFAKLPKYDGDNGFNLFAQAREQGTMQVSMTSGHCGACTFEVGVGKKSDKNTVQVDETTNELIRDKVTGDVICGREGQDEVTPQDWQQDTTQRETWIALKKDTSTYGTILPSKKRNVIPSTDDTFVILNINLPDAYIFNAEKKLEESIIKYMSENNVEKFTFDIKFSRIYFTEHPEVLDMLNENSRIIVEYNGQQHTLYVDSYSYKMDDSNPLPEIEVSLTDTLSVGQNSLKNAITQVTTDILKSPNGDFLAQGTKYFLRKDVEDAAQKTITFEQGLKSNNIESKNFTSGALGSGHKLYTDPDTGESYCEIDRLYVRMKAYFDTLEIKEVSHIGGELILTPASMKCNRVEVIEPMPFFYVDGTQKVYSDGKLAYTARKYRCYFNADDGDEAIQNQFVVGDLAYCKQFNIESGIYTNVSNRFYWYEVTGVGSNYIEITEGQCAEGSDIPKEGDTIVSLGNRTDTFRQNAIILSTVGINAPSKILYQGINDYSLSGKAIIEEGFDPESNQAYQKIYGKTYIGARDESSYLNFDPVKNELEVRAKLDVLPDSQGMSVFEDAMDFAQQTNNVMSQYLGYVDWDELVNATLKGKTIIKDGLINTELIFAQTINAQQAIIKNLVLENAKVSGNIYTPMVVIREENWRDYLNTTNDGDGADIAYINWDKSGLNVQINYWPDLVTSAESVTADILKFPVGKEFLGCEANVFFTISSLGSTSLGMSYMYYNTSSRKWLRMVNGFLGIGFYKLRLIDVLGLWATTEELRYQWAIQSFQPISDL